MKKLHAITLLLFLLFFKGFSQKITCLAEAINIAGKQRILGQRITKNKFYLELNKDNKIAKKQLERNTVSFYKSLNRLKELAPNNKIKQKLALTEHTFKTYINKQIDSSKTVANEVIENNKMFLNICNDVISTFIDTANELDEQDIIKDHSLCEISAATETCSEIRSLTEKLTLYLAINRYELKEITPEESKEINPKKIEEIINKMEQHFSILDMQSFNTTTIDKVLGDAWYKCSILSKGLYKNNVINLNSELKKEAELYKLCNSIFEKTNQISNMYVDIGKSKI